VPTRYDLDRAALGELLAGEPAYRVQQVWTGLYGQLREPCELTNLSKALRARLTDDLDTALRGSHWSAE
jgi:23S rRNA (adenine2503-C2)-methyltransferase